MMARGKLEGGKASQWLNCGWMSWWHALLHLALHEEDRRHIASRPLTFGRLTASALHWQRYIMLHVISRSWELLETGPTLHI